MQLNKQAALSIEKQQLNKQRKYYVSIAEINNTLANVHKDLLTKLDIAKYQYATDYINQYISHTTVWNLKFVMNMENGEVALLQIFHLDYILSKELESQFKTERDILQQQKEKFLSLEYFTLEKIIQRHQQMLTFIKEKSNLNP